MHLWNFDYSFVATKHERTAANRGFSNKIIPSNQVAAPKVLPLLTTILNAYKGRDNRRQKTKLYSANRLPDFVAKKQ